GRGHRQKSTGVLLAPIGKALIRSVHDPVCQTAVFHRVPPIPVDAQRLNVDPTAVDLLNPLHVQSPAPGLPRKFGIRDNRLDFIDGRVRMDVDDSHTASADFHFPARYRAGGLRYLPRTPAPAPLRFHLSDVVAHG